MASKKIATKIDDCQRVLALRAADDNAGTLTIHIPDMLMRANRRQYTQARAYDFTLQVDGVVGNPRTYKIFTLSNAWWVKRSIEMAKGVWLASTKKERAMLAESDRAAKWGDFIIGSNTGASATFSNLHQYSPAASGDDMTEAEVAHDETIYEGPREGTDLKDDSGDKMGFTVNAADTSGDGVFNIFDEYLLTRQHVSPQDTRAGPYADLFEIDEDALLSLKGDGDQAPWDLDAFPSPFVLQDVIQVDADGAGWSHRSSRMTAPLGIVIVKKVETDSASEQNIVDEEQFLLRVSKGTYKGVHAPAYKAMPSSLGN